MSIHSLPASSGIYPESAMSPDMSEASPSIDGDLTAHTHAEAETAAIAHYPALGNASRIFTIGFCGTGSNSSDADISTRYGNGELVSTLLRHTDGAEYVDKLTVDGVGSGNHLMGSAFTTFVNHDDRIAKLTGDGMAQNARHAQNVLHGKSDRIYPDACPVAGSVARLSAWLRDTWHALTGLGSTSTQIAEVEAKVRSLEKRIADYRAGEITQINLVAWSRGSATAQIFANRLSEDPVLRKIDVRMVAIDPVAGPWNHGPTVMTIPPNVKEAIFYTAVDERSYFFETFLPTNRKGRMDDATSVIPMAGNHAMLVGGHNKAHFDVTLGNAVRDGMRMRVADHLRQWGSVIHETLPGITTTVPMMNVRRLDELDAKIDRARESGAFSVLNRSGYLGPLTHLFDKVYALKDAYATLPTERALARPLQWESMNLRTVESVHPWLSSAVQRFIDSTYRTLAAMMPYQTRILSGSAAGS